MKLIRHKRGRGVPADAMRCEHCRQVAPVLYDELPSGRGLCADCSAALVRPASEERQWWQPPNCTMDACYCKPWHTRLLVIEEEP